ncbi:enoyl-CoA hydratase/isomerase family protein [Mesorhizobium sp. ANAO-SY3R2]|uniref:enoyl-CoA hydratase/isomerase family protein n=1 Tax=Mesorhizobium sp. ANAO-SY3R2 TaxID=3166644 RepID=UPI00366E525D
MTSQQASEVSVQFEAVGGIAAVWLNRPDAANSINLGLAAELRQTFALIAARQDIRVVILRGRGGKFCAGGDMGMFVEFADELGSHLRGVIGDFHAAVQAIHDLSVPVVAVVEGPAAGGGMSLALACDFVIAEEKSKFAPAYRKLGATSDGGLCKLLSDAVGQRKALELMLTGNVLTANDALALGLVNRVVPADRLEHEVASLCETLAANSGPANAGVKKLIYGASRASLGEQLAGELEVFCGLAEGPDFREGVRAFAERRPPNFSRASAE